MEAPVIGRGSYLMLHNLWHSPIFFFHQFNMIFTLPCQMFSNMYNSDAAALKSYLTFLISHTWCNKIMRKWVTSSWMQDIKYYIKVIIHTIIEEDDALYTARVNLFQCVVFPEPQTENQNLLLSWSGWFYTSHRVIFLCNNKSSPRAHTHWRSGRERSEEETCDIWSKKEKAFVTHQIRRGKSQSGKSDGKLSTVPVGTFRVKIHPGKKNKTYR